MLEISPGTGPVFQGGGRGRGGINPSIKTGGTNSEAPPSSPAARGNSCAHQTYNRHSQEASSGKPLAGMPTGAAPSCPPGLPAYPSNNFTAPPGVMPAGSSTSVSNAMQDGSLDKPVTRTPLNESREANAYTLGDGVDDKDPVDEKFIPNRGAGNETDIKIGRYQRGLWRHIVRMMIRSKFRS